MHCFSHGLPHAAVTAGLHGCLGAANNRMPMTLGLPSPDIIPLCQNAHSPHEALELWINLHPSVPFQATRFLLPYSCS
jgi:hypothetical protein